MTEGKRKEDRAGGRICWSKHQGLGKPNLERGFWGPAGPLRLEEPLYHPGSPCSLSWVPRPQQPRAWVLLGQQAAQSPASSLRPPRPSPTRSRGFAFPTQPPPGKGTHRPEAGTGSGSFSQRQKADPAPSCPTLSLSFGTRLPLGSSSVETDVVRLRS